MPAHTPPQPLTCEQVHALFAELLEDRLGAERRGRVQGHLLSCAACSAALAQTIDARLISGDLTPPAVPPVPVPAALLPPIESLSPYGVVRGGLWEGLRQWAKAAATQTSAAARRVRQAQEELAQKIQRLQETYNLWRRWDVHLLTLTILDIPPWPKDVEGGSGWVEADANLRGHILPPSDSSGAGALQVQHLDDTGQPTGDMTALDEKRDFEEGPRISDGRFLLTLSAADVRWAGRRLLCSLRLIEGGAIRFGAELQPAGGRWRAEFRAEGLPWAKESLAIPLAFLTFYLVRDQAALCTRGSTCSQP